MRLSHPTHPLSFLSLHAWKSLFPAGCLPAVIGMAPAGAVFYGVYDLLKARHLAALVAEREAGAVSGAGAAHRLGQGQGLAAPNVPPQYTLLYGAMAGECGVSGSTEGGVKGE